MATGARGEDLYYQLLYKSYVPTDDRSHPTSSSRRGRKDVLPWEDYFMALALLAAQRSEDPVTKVGAIIVRGMSCTERDKLHQVKKITGIGYNCMPAGIGIETRRKLWDIKTGDWEKTKYPYVCHAAINAILNKNAEDLTGCTLFTTHLPSNEDAKLIIQAGITEVVYCEDRQRRYNHIARKMFVKTGIEYTQFETYRRNCTDLRVKECEELATTHRRKKDLEEGVEMCEQMAVEYEKAAQVERSRQHRNLDLYPKAKSEDPEVKEDATPGTAEASISADPAGKEDTLTPKSEDPEVKEDATPGTAKASISADPAGKEISPDEYYMGIACLSAERSKDPTRQVGACIVNLEGEVVGIGYNGWPYGISDDDPDFSWDKVDKDPVGVKYPYVVHAEANAIMHTTCISLKACRIYTTLFPCNECAKLIIQSGITEVYYLRKPNPERLWVQASRHLLSIAGYIGPDLDQQPSPTGDPSNRTHQQLSRDPELPKKCQPYRPERQIMIRWPIPGPDETENGKRSRPEEKGTHASRKLDFNYKQ